MMTINYTRNNDGSIVLERELTENENRSLIKNIVKPDCIEYYFKGDELPFYPEDTNDYKPNLITIDLNDKDQLLALKEALNNL